jgi:DNA-binding transcriptional LysR family regulator
MPNRLFQGRIPRQLRSVDFRLLLAFEALIAERHVSRAAAAVGLSQPAMSHALAKLRQQFNDPLLARTSTGFEPTPKALELVEPVRDAIRQVNGLFTEGSAFDPSTSSEGFTIRMGDMNEVLFLPSAPASPPGAGAQRHGDGAASHAVGNHSRPGSERHRLRSQRAHQAFQVGPFAGIGEGPHGVRHAQGHPAAAARLTTRAFLALRHLRIVQSAGDVRFVDEALYRHGLQRKVMATTPHWLAASYLVENSDLVTALSESMARQLNADDRFAVRPLPWAAAIFSWRLYWHRRYDARPAHRWLRSMFESTSRK